MVLRFFVKRRHFFSKDEGMGIGEEILLGGLVVLCALISGTLGMGGGTLFLGSMLWLTAPAYAIPLHAFFQIFSSGGRVVIYFREIRWKIVRDFLLGALPSALVGLLFFRFLPADWIQTGIAVFVIGISWLPRGGRSGERWTAGKAMLFAGFLAGFFGVFFGAVGPLLTPFFLHEGLRKEEFVGTKACCQWLLHWVKVFGFGWVGYNILSLGFDRLGVVALLVIFSTLLARRWLRRWSAEGFAWVVRVLVTILMLALLGKTWL